MPIKDSKTEDNFLLLSLDRWEDLYKPKDSIFDTDASYNGWMLEMSSKQVDCAFNHRGNCWTIVENDGEIVLLAGFHS